MDLGTGSAVLGQRDVSIVRNSSLGRVGFFPREKKITWVLWFHPLFPWKKMG